MISLNIRVMYGIALFCSVENVSSSVSSLMAWGGEEMIERYRGYFFSVFRVLIFLEDFTKTHEVVN